MQFSLRLLFLLLLANISVLAVDWPWGQASINLPDRVGSKSTVYQAVEALLHDAIQEDPKTDKNYAFIEYWPGSTLENLCNGGGHARLVVGNFLKGSRKEFRGHAFDLIYDKDPENYKKAEGVHQSWGKGDVELALKKKNTYRVIPPSRITQDIPTRQLLDRVRKAISSAQTYFEKYPDYDYVRNNCGHYVNFLATVIA
ncbi:hypothetical protein BDW02DRAFT_605702 [Decorospora gaudefroyi]|uniref:DUF862-domain-containing protein n=1 Tax=Decorospora gaudefroyi TaxID=184978 RepID=A0A6A5KAJ8_9PLEO|nr:hypothetical protein BDW02DRAFT_605702 [Decorospora gaudefroyi]